MEKRPFSELGLSPEVLKAVDKMGFEEASPIQTAVIPTILEGRDVVGQSSTGSGKTAAFAIPAIERVDAKMRAVQVLVLCPTRELAVQVAEEFGKLSSFKRGVHVVPIYGGQSYDRQFRALEMGTQVVIGTPGRVLDHIDRGTLRLNDLKLVILDEADRMLDMGFREDIEKVLIEVPKERQLLFFSATMPGPIQELIRRFSRNPAWIKIEAHAQNAPQVEQVYYEVDRRSKIEVLTRLIDLHDFRFGIIFCSTKIMVDELDEHLHSRGYSVDRLHGDITQAQRTRVMEKFRKRGFEFLIATDVAARGLDVDDLEVVFNYDLPNDAEDYTHRIGRTGRAGRSGRAVTFVSGRELYKLQSMVRFAKLRIKREPIPTLEEVEEARENVFFDRLRAVLQDGKFEKQDRALDRLLEQGHASTDICSALIHLLRETEGSQARDVPPPPASRTEKRAEWKSFADEKPRAPAAPYQAPEREESAKPRRARAEFEAQEDRKPKFERPNRTGREAGFVSVYLNVGRKSLVTPGDIVGKIAGVTRQPASIVGAIDIHQRHTLVDVAADHAPLVLEKLAGVRIKGQSLIPSLAKDIHIEEE